ncbi:MAG: PQQ-dependent sugar dehydrogenase [Rhodospirillales bacterium]|nr:PQQ-dependent sugar dehydrogenase [Rhodospirillales bacterium]
MAQTAVTPNPISDPIRKSGIKVELDDFVTPPRTDDVKPYANIQFLYHADDGSGRLYLIDTRGVVWQIENGKVDPSPLLDVRGDPDFVNGGTPTGLRSFAFHPDFETPSAAGYGKLYTVNAKTVASAPAGVPVFDGPYTPVYHSTIIEWQVARPADPGPIVAGSGREVLRVAQPEKGHDLNQIAFNPAAKPGSEDYGALYIASGDGGNNPPRPDRFDAGQDLQQALSKILRIDPLKSGSASYTVPADNPFVGRSDALPEVWATGFRNPQNFSFDQGGRGDLLIGEIGQAQIEEVNIGVAGGNYGWQPREGTFATARGDQGVLYTLPGDDSGFTYPVAQYDHDEGRAIAGGFVYRGADIPELAGHYVFGDIAAGRVFHVPLSALQTAQKSGRPAEIKELTLLVNGAERTLLDVVKASRADLRFGQDANGEIYVLTKQDGQVRKLASASDVAPTPTPDPGPVAGLGRVEAEDLALTRYVVASSSEASGGALIRTLSNGVATHTFNGTKGTYDLKVRYLDEDDGTSRGTLKVAGVEVDRWDFDKGDGWTIRSKTVSLDTGDRIELATTQNAGEYGRVDYLEVARSDGTPVPTPTPTPTPDPGPTAGVGRLEAEDLALTRYAVASSSEASGGALIRTLSNGVATHTFNGTKGTYDLKVRYLDEDDGTSRGTLKVAGVEVDRWDFDKGDGWTVRSKTVSLDTGDRIELATTQNAGEYGRVDYLEVTRSDGTPAPTPTPTPTPDPGPTAGVGRLEAEDLALTRYAVTSSSEASGGELIRTFSNGVATHTFGGDNGRYKISVRYLDEDDGSGSGAVTVEGKQISNWRFDAGGGWKTHSLFANLEQGDRIDISTARDAGEYGRVDYVELELWT